jgi:hypothetical protein
MQENSCRGFSPSPVKNSKINRGKIVLLDKKIAWCYLLPESSHRRMDIKRIVSSGISK